MKNKSKFTFLIVAALGLATALTSCSKNDELTSTDEKGFLKLSLLEPSVDIEVASKAATTVSDSYNVVITGGSSNINKTYGELKTPFTLAAATYSIYAQNCTAVDAVLGRGQQHFFGESTFNITSGNTTNVAFECAMKNVRVSVGYTDTFKAVFKDATVTVYENTDDTRKLTYPYTAVHTDESLWTYFNIDATPEVVVVIEVTRNDNTPNVYTKKIENISSRNWYKINLSATSSNGEAGLSITVDESLVDQNVDMDIDPYSAPLV